MNEYFIKWRRESGMSAVVTAIRQGENATKAWEAEKKGGYVCGDPLDDSGFDLIDIHKI